MRRRQFLAGIAASAPALAAPALALSPEHKRLLGAGANSPSLDLSFLNTGSLDGRITFTRASNATYFDTTGTLQTATTNVPRFDNDPVTLASLGLLIEEQRTNSVANARGETIIVGSPGTPPSGWSVTSTGGVVTRTVVGNGTSTDGVPYWDVRFQFSAAGSAGISWVQNTVVAAASGQTWTVSGFASVVAGSLSNLGATIGINELSGAGAFLTGSNTSIFPTNGALAAQRVSIIRTFNNASTAFAGPNFNLNASGAADITLRMGAVQLELGAFATSVILPPAGTPAAATRAVESASLPLSAWFNPVAGTFASQAMFPQASNANDAYVFRASDGTTNNRIDLFRAAGTNTLKASVVIGGVTVVNAATVGTIVPGTSFKAALSYSGAGVSAAFNGAAPTSLTASAVSAVGFTTMSVGSTGAASYADGYSQRDRYWQRALSSAELQQVTT